MTPEHSSYKKSSFGPAFLFLEKDRREALAVYYAFCRLMDDIADEPDVQNPQEQLAFWQKEIENIFEGNPTTALGKDIQKVAEKYGMPADRFLLLIEGMQADLQGRRYENFEDLSWYLWRVAGIVGLATLDILGVKGPRAEQLARTLGFAVQTTNIVRDVYEDIALQRVYLPQDLLERHHLSYEDVLQKNNPKALSAAVAELAEKSKGFYAEAAEIIKTFPRRKMLPCKIMGFVYRANLAKIEKMDFCFSQAVKLSKREKLVNCIYALFKQNFNL